MKMTYNRLVFIGVFLSFFGFLLSFLTGISWFHNLGWILFGLVVILFPAWPESASNRPGIRRHVQMAGVIIILIGCLVRYGAAEKTISKEIGIDVSRGKVIQSYDDHGGFHGDGITFQVISFTHEKAASEIRQSPLWKPLPASENVKALAYGIIKGNTRIGPFINKEGVPVFPEIENGYYFLYDRQGKTFNDSMVLLHSSFNVTMAMYDSDQNILYYCKYDT